MKTIATLSKTLFFTLIVLSVVSGCKIEVVTTEGEATISADADISADDQTTDEDVSTVKSVELAWETPTQREDGSSLYIYDIQGYEVKYRNVDDSDYSTLELAMNDSDVINSATVELDGAGVYEFSIAVYDVNGLYSDYSDPVQITIE